MEDRTENQNRAIIERTERLPEPPRVTPQAIQETKQQMALLQGMVRDILVREVDYGRIPGTPQDSLWDPGASKIISAFNCYSGERRLISLRDNAERISVLMEVPLVSRTSGQVVATGVGAASTLETRYRYRWLTEDETGQQGFGADVLATFKSRRKKDGTMEFRVPNPEHGELLNTIIKMASKRAEVDAAESLPGVASVLRQLFTGQAQRPKAEDSPVWTRFWGEVRRMGLTDEEAHRMLRVKSMKEWIASGRSLDAALESLRQALAQPAESQVDEVSNLEAAEPQQSGEMEEPRRDPNSIKTFGELYQACKEDFDGMNRPTVWFHLGVTSQIDIIDTPANCYRRVRSAWEKTQAT